jgi:hypothetical protein
MKERTSSSTGLVWARADAASDKKRKRAEGFFMDLKDTIAGEKFLQFGNRLMLGSHRW